MNSFWLISSFLVLCTWSVCYGQDSLDVLPDGCSWDTYLGKKDPNALPGGKDQFGRVTHICRAKHGPAMVPGVIEQQKKECHIVLNNALHKKSISDDFEYLRCKNKKLHDQFAWVQTDAVKHRMEVHYRWVLGGYDEGGLDKGYALTVCKKVWNRGVCVGNGRMQKEWEGMAFAIDDTNFKYDKTNFYCLTFEDC